MTKETLDSRELSERDLLIQLKTEVGFIKDQIVSIGTKVSKAAKDNGFLATKVAQLEIKIQENTDFRKWTYAAVATAIFQILVTVIYIVYNLEK